MADTAGQLTDHELELHSTDQANSPYIKMRGMLYWNGAAWVKWDGDVVVDEEDTATATTTGQVSVGMVSTAVLAANANRIATILVNDSDTDIYINLSGTAAMMEGIRLNAFGGSLVEKNYTGAVTAICGAANKNLTVTEL